MVRNDRLKKTGESTKLIAGFVEERRRAKSLTQKQIASALGEKTSQSYVSVRLRGKAAWTMDDLDAIAPLIDFDNAIELIGNLARKRAAEENGPGLLARQFVAIMDGDNVVQIIDGPSSSIPVSGLPHDTSVDTGVTSDKRGTVPVPRARSVKPSSLSDEERKRIVLEKLRRGDVSLAANKDPHKLAEMEGGDGR